ncbi:hypothetical protein ACM2V4_27435, partial [Escherichia coli]
GEVIIQENNRMLKRRDAFLKKSALAVSMALLLSAQAQALEDIISDSDIFGFRQRAYSYTDAVKADILDETSRDRERLGTELRKEILEGTSAAVAYTDAAATVLQEDISESRQRAYNYTDAVKADVLDETRTYTDSSVRTVRNEVKSQAEHLSDVLVKNRAQTDAAIASNTAAIRNNSHRLDLT